MHEHARIYIPVCIDMQIPLASGNTSAHIFRIILKVHGEQRLRGTQMANTVINGFTLLGIWQQFRRSIIANRHIMEVPDEISTHVNQTVIVCIRCNLLVIHAGITRGNAVGQLFLMQQLHCPNDLLIGSLSAAAVRGNLVPLQRNGRNKVLHAQHFIGKLFINQCRIRKAKEYTIIMLFAQPNQIILSRQRLTAGIDIHICTKFLSLCYDVIDRFERKIQFMSVFCSPASGTVQVTG